jgi:hypothetical protein
VILSSLHERVSGPEESLLKGSEESPGRSAEMSGQSIKQLNPDADVMGSSAVRASRACSSMRCSRARLENESATSQRERRRSL